MESLPPELLMEVYIYNEFPISFILINKRIYELCMSPIAKAKWVLRNFGKTHALFHAIRLGKSFIVVEIITSLLELKANFSRYFFQRLSQQTQSNIGEEYDPLYLNRIADSWFPDIPFDVYSLLFNEGRARFASNLCINGDDVELFGLLSGESLEIDQASILINENLKEIEDLIVDKKFTPFPDKLFMVARAIVLEPGIVHMWKGIGHDICKDLNDLVIKDCIKLSPPTPPNKKEFMDRLNTFVDVGFELTTSAKIDILHLYKGQPEICDFILESFYEIKNNQNRHRENMLE
ncbi:863_t:CDS:1 [Entrophospora sp. SA101]|nr:863_t:CDS:1 [Entrophospora sp. SA101]CAJ0844587.1 20272_t:CDS:1 [Entrophospora sp. SA101]